MKEYAVPVWVTLRGLATVRATSKKEARKLAADHGHLPAADFNSAASCTNDAFQKTKVRKGPIKLVDDELAKTLDNWDNDRGVPW